MGEKNSMYSIDMVKKHTQRGGRDLDLRVIGELKSLTLKDIGIKPRTPKDIILPRTKPLTPQTKTIVKVSKFLQMPPHSHAIQSYIERKQQQIKNSLFAKRVKLGVKKEKAEAQRDKILDDIGNLEIFMLTAYSAPHQIRNVSKNASKNRNSEARQKNSARKPSEGNVNSIAKRKEKYNIRLMTFYNQILAEKSTVNSITFPLCDERIFDNNEMQLKKPAEFEYLELQKIFPTPPTLGGRKKAYPKKATARK